MSVPFRRLILALLVFGAAVEVEVEVEAASPRQLDSGTSNRHVEPAGESQAVKDYTAEVKRQIKQAWQPPKGHENDIVVIVFAVDKNGAVNNMRMRKSSGVVAVDDAAKDAVTRAAPFGAPPGESGGSLGLYYVFGE